MPSARWFNLLILAASDYAPIFEASRVCGPITGENMKYLFAAVLVAGTVAGFSGAGMPQAAAAPVGIAGPMADAILIAVLSLLDHGCTSEASWVLAAASTLNRGCMSGASSGHVAASSSNRACTSGALSGRVGACERRLNLALRTLPPVLRTAGR